MTRVLRSGWLTTGDEALALEAELAARLDVPHVVAVSSCTAAIEIGLRALDLPAGSRIGVPVWTFVATALPAVHLGFTPVLLDVDPHTLNLAPSSLDAALGQGLDAVVPVHFGGVPVSRAVHESCAAAGVPVLEDAAARAGCVRPSRADRGPGQCRCVLLVLRDEEPDLGRGRRARRRIATTSPRRLARCDSTA